MAGNSNLIRLQKRFIKISWNWHTEIFVFPFPGSRMSTSLLSSRRSSMASSMIGSVDDLRMDFGTSTFSTNLGLSYVLNERNIHGGSNMSLDRFSNISRTGSMSGWFCLFYSIFPLLFFVSFGDEWSIHWIYWNQIHKTKY